jgi:hypothetical protein
VRGRGGGCCSGAAGWVLLVDVGSLALFQSSNIHCAVPFSPGCRCLLAAACKFDLRFVPREQSFKGRHVRDEALDVPAGAAVCNARLVSLCLAEVAC